ncbi:ferredoxin--NADP+ reductase [Cryobacterium mesophilum]|uniref:ferredoxin--NADP(+) reductase n=1 Tax=Terrimesophilobacter mesophilus TaxID=433647 RepID=A0A4R8VBU6_9MICO|nr:FAD-dependent oxidoreductase [Terrimesophilobacter mesophilus]MBB5633402.1 ferredoxin--NADP+ reductase [Terrimesophilobacter mesophilus]TFB80125.1 pyridine nucleotide-disulfide oxidoreductase [Terrimesophilobacter mesophilus]
MSERQKPVLRVAIVGAGPAGIYAADLLLKAERPFQVSIDLFEQLPAPYGLVRYGVAPDHPRIKGIVNALRDVLDGGNIRFFGNVRFGTDITLDDLKRHYNAVIFTTGAIRDAELDIPGIELLGSFGASQFVSWYDGHPDVPRDWPLDHTSAAVIGNGNVALDVARMLAKHAEDLLPTEVPANVYDRLVASPITDVHIFGRRGPIQVRFTPLELRELGELRDVDIILDDADFGVDESDERSIATSKQLLVINRILTEWRSRETGRASRRIHLHFYSRPAEILGSDRVTGLRVERTAPDGEGGAHGTGEFREFPVDAVYRAVGYFGSPLDGVPFDDRRGVIPNRAGRAIDDEDERVHGVYASGWIKRGPVGLIGATKSDAMETVQALLGDQSEWWSPSEPDTDAIPRMLEARGIRYTTVQGWHRLDAHERALGEAQQRERVKVVPREEMVEISDPPATAQPT